jgi:DNA-binding NtrC family response regulator
MHPVPPEAAKPTSTILVVDDEYLIRWTLETSLSQAGFRVITASTCAEALEAVGSDRPDLVLLDLKLPDGDGMTLMGRIKEERPDVLVIMITANGQVEIAVEAMRRGAHDFFPKPFQVEEVRLRVEQALATIRLRKEVDLLRSQQKQEWGIDRIIGQSPPMLRVLEMVRKISASEASTILLQGESGTGKDLLAKAIHASGGRREHPFLALNCSAVPATLLESELFGHEKGAFTDARQMKKGLFELADGGTLLLDEIGTMRLELQSKLLRVLEERSFKRVGGTKDVKVDVRIIAATNQDLEEEKGKGEFRADLFYRLNVIPITLPPLRERGKDILLLAKFFLDGFNREFRKNIKGFTKEAEERLLTYPWPGNIRELKNAIERIVLLESGDLVGATQLSMGEKPQAAAVPRRYLEPGVTIDELERRIIVEALEAAGGNQSRAARLLGLGRDALRYRLKKFGMDEAAET